MACLCECVQVMQVYQNWLKGFQGEDNTVRRTFTKAEATLRTAEKARDFVRQLAADTEDMVNGQGARLDGQKKEAQRQFMSFLDTHLETLKETMELISRRVKFCDLKLESMKNELQEALDLGMSDVANDLAMGLKKFGEMHQDARKRVTRTGEDVKKIEAIIEGFSSDGEDEEGTAMRLRAEGMLEEIKTMHADILSGIKA